MTAAFNSNLKGGQHGVHQVSQNRADLYPHIDPANPDPEPYIARLNCTRCGRLVEIRVPHPLQSSLVISMWANELGGLCEDCLKQKEEMMKELAILFAIVRLLEGNIQGQHPDKVSYGPAGVTQGALTDVNAAHGTHYTLKDMDDPAKALDVFDKYTVLVCQRKDWRVTPENRLRAWHPSHDPKDDYVERGLNLFADAKESK